MILEATNLTKKRGSKVLLDGFSMSLNMGRIYGLIGKAKSGKTSVLRAVTGLTRVNSGTVRWGIERDRVGAYVGEPAFHRELSARQNLIVQSMLLRGKVDYARIDYLMDKLMIAARHIGDRSIRNMLLNERQAAAITMAMLGSPDMLMLDEPFLGLDSAWAEAFRSLLKDDIIDKGKSALIAAPTEEALKGIATDFIYIDGGRNA